MNTYLYTWNPKRWKWLDQPEAVYRVSNGEVYDMPWSCGRNEKIAIGDQFLLMRLGVDPKGIIGCGYITSKPYLSKHWDDHRAAKGDMALRTDLLFVALSETPVFSLSDLCQHFSDYRWTPETGGVRVPKAISQAIFSGIQKARGVGLAPKTLEEIQLYVEGKPKTVTVRTYDRSPQARQACIEHYGYDCSVCGFNFEESYGPVGADYVEVHHLRPIAGVGEEHEINPIDDLRPVCANCHRILHRHRPPLSIEELRALIQNKQTLTRLDTTSSRTP